MDVILIAAITLEGFIAKRSDEVITWSKDLKLFKKQTMGHPVLMGSNTYKALTTDLNGRQKIVVHREDNPEHVLSKLDTDKCFIIGGGMTNAKFAKFLSHLYLTPHPILFGGGVKLFANLKNDIKLELQKAVVANESEKIIQYQYKIIR